MARGRLARWGGLVLMLIFTLLYLLNLPFYTGSSLGNHWMWRMEHGRLRIQRADQVSTESFYIALNSEGLRFRPEVRFMNIGNWNVNLPLWVPLTMVTAATVWSWTAHRRHRLQGCCRRCGYDLRGLGESQPCPECGAAKSRSRSIAHPE